MWNRLNSSEKKRIKKRGHLAPVLVGLVQPLTKVTADLSSVEPHGE